MKYTFSILLLAIAILTKAQDLPINPQTGLVSIQDSLQLTNSSLQEIKGYLTQWGYTLLDEANLKAVYKLNNAKQTEIVAINLPVGSVLTRDLGGSRFSTNGTFVYTKAKTSGLNALSPVVVSGGIKFSFTYTIRAKNLIYEFANMEYSHDMVYYGKFEDEKPPKDNYNRSLLFKMSKKEWQQVRKDYYVNMQILSGNLKEYLTNLIGANPSQPEPSKISYAAYQAIKAGMLYEEIKKLLEDEGKETSNAVFLVNGKNVTQQTIVWRDLDNTKSIAIIFQDGKVVSKSQSNL